MVRLMVVEDHDLIREAVCDALEGEPDLHVVACCADGLEALERLDQADPDVVLTDLVMPNVDGVQLARQVRQRRPHVRVVVFTSQPHGQQAGRALAAGASSVVAKGGDLGAVITAVRAAGAAA